MKKNQTRPTFDDLADSALVRQADLVPNPKYPERVTLLKFSASTLWRNVKAGKFPKPIKLGGRATFFRVGDIRAWLQQQMALATNARAEGVAA